MVVLVNFKADEEFLAEIDKAARTAGYHTRTEFIREALRDKTEEINMKQRILALKKMKGKSKRKTTNKEIHSIREKAFNEIRKKLK